MAPNTITRHPNGVRLTPLAALLDSGLRATKGRSLATTLAILRMPSRTWMTYDTIAALLEVHAAGRPLNRTTIKTFAEDTFGIPNTRYARVDGKAVNMPKAVPVDVVNAYIDALDPDVGIDVDAVRAVAEQERQAAELAAREEAEAAAEAADDGTGDRTDA